MRFAPWLAAIALAATAVSHSLSTLADQAKPSADASRFDPQRLALALRDVEAEHALALLEARRGKLDAALARLQKLLARAEIGDHKPLVEREITRVQAFTRLRDAHLAELVANGAKVTFEYEGKKVVAKIASVADGKLMLVENKQKLASVPIETLDLLDMARAMSPQVTGGPDGWARCYMYVLAGDERGTKQLKGDAPEVTALRTDAEQWYPGALKLGAAAEQLASLAAHGEPRDKAAADACLALLATLSKDYGALELIRNRATTLKALAMLALAQQFDPSKLAGLVAGKLESLSADSVRITYEFDRKEELADFAADHGYLASLHKQAGALGSTERRCDVSGGGLNVVGAGCLRHVVAFEAPLMIRYDVTLGGVSEAGRGLFAVGACDDHAESRIDCQGFGSLWVADRPSGFNKSSPQTAPFQFQPGKSNTIELKVDGGKVSSSVNGTTMHSVECGPRTKGDVFLFFHCDKPIVFNKLVIEGKPVLDAARAKWVEQEVTKLGF